jgi:hypothetical protein
VLIRPNSVTDMRPRFMAGLLVAATSLLFAGVLVTPAVAQTELRVSATVDGGPFLVGTAERVPITFTVTNNGTQERRVRGTVRTVEGSPLSIRDWTWGDLTPSGEGALLAPGESRTYRLEGYLSEWAGQSRVALGVWRQTPNIPEIAETEVSIPVVAPDATETVTGTAYTDRNDNGTAEPGEELAGATVRLGSDHQAVTDADGRYTMTVPVGHHDVAFGGAPDGWLLPGAGQVRLDGAGTTDLPVRARLSLADRLETTVVLDRGLYQPGDAAVLTATVTNTSAVPVTGVVAGCDRTGTAFHVWTEVEAWGELAFGGPGATVLPGQTRVFTVPGVVPAASKDDGVVTAICDFGDDRYDFDQGPAFYAKVPGGPVRNPSADIFHDLDDDYSVDEGEAVAAVRVGLRDVTTGRVVAIVTSDANGRLAYTGVPVGVYTVKIFGPWQPLSPNGSRFHVKADDTVNHLPLRVVPRN